MTDGEAAIFHDTGCGLLMLLILNHRIACECAALGAGE